MPVFRATCSISETYIFPPSYKFPYNSSDYKICLQQLSRTVFHVCVFFYIVLQHKPCRVDRMDYMLPSLFPPVFQELCKYTYDIPYIILILFNDRRYILNSRLNTIYIFTASVFNIVRFILWGFLGFVFKENMGNYNIGNLTFCYIFVS